MKTKKNQADYIHKGFGAVRPYLYGPTGIVDFIVKTFSSDIIEENEEGPTLLQIHDSFIWVESGELPSHIEPWAGSVYVYVEDVDAVYSKAMESGAESLAPPENKPYNERQAGFKDVAGNTWWVSTYAPVVL